MLVKMTLPTLVMISNFRIKQVLYIYIHIYKHIYIYIYIYIYVIYIYKAILTQFLAYPLLKVRDWMV